MNYNISSYGKICETKSATKNNWKNNDILNNYINISNQISKISNYNSNDILKESQINAKYKDELFNILVEDTPFKHFNNKFKKDLIEVLEFSAKYGSVNEKADISKENSNIDVKIPKEIKSIEKYQNEMIDTTVSKIIKTLFTVSKKNLPLMVNDDNADVFKAFEESIKELPLLTLSKAINQSHQYSIAEIKCFFVEIIQENKNEKFCTFAAELWLLLFTRMSGLDNILEWLDLIISRSIIENCSMIRTEIINAVIESLFIGEKQFNAEMVDHMRDCIDFDIIDQETVDVKQAINCMFLGILRSFKIHLKTFNSGYNSTEKKRVDIFKDLYIWEHCDKVQLIKAAYPDSLLTRLNATSENYFVKQVVCCQKEVIMVNSLGQIRSRSISFHSNNNDIISKLLSQCWSPINFPDVNCKIDKIAIGWAEENSLQHILAMSRFGQVYSWGGGSFGRLGHGDIQDRQIPTLIESLRGYNIKMISCGTTHSSAVSETGLGFLWGNSIFFNGKENENCLRPKRLQEGIMSNIICSPNSTFYVDVNKQNIYYLGSQYIDRKLYGDQFILSSYPNIIEGLPRTDIESNNKERIDKIVANSTGILVLLQNGHLYSIGQGLVLGCPDCSLHKTFERVKSMSNINVLDIDVSDTHVIVLSDYVIYSWSLTTETLVLVQKSFDYCLTSVSANYLIDHNKQINIAWSQTFLDSTSNVSNSLYQNRNPFLTISSISHSLLHFNSILNTCLNRLTSSSYYDQLILNTLKLFTKCIESDQFAKLSDLECQNQLNELMMTILHVGDYRKGGISEKLKKVVCKIIRKGCPVFYAHVESKVSCINEIMEKNSNSTTFLKPCVRYMLKNLLLSFNDPSKGIPFFQLYHLSLPKLDHLLISICKALSIHTINKLQRKMSVNTYRFEEDNEEIDNLSENLMHEFSTIGYRIYLSLLRQEDINNKNNNYNPINNLCSLLPLTNSIIGCFKSYLQYMTKTQKISHWIKSKASEEINNSILNVCPMSWLLFDVLNFFIDCPKWDILPVISHLERMLISLDSINILLPKTSINDTQELQWSLYGFSGVPNMTDIIPEVGSSWLWLLELQRLTGLVLGNLFYKSFQSLNMDVDKKLPLTLALETVLIKHIIKFPINLTTNNINRTDKLLSSSYENFLRIINLKHTDQYFKLIPPHFACSIGYHIYNTVIYLAKSKFPTLSFRYLNCSVVIHNSFMKTLNEIVKCVTQGFEEDALSQNPIMAQIQNDRWQRFISVFEMKCNFLINLFTSSETSDLSQNGDIIDSQPSSLIGALTLATPSELESINNRSYLSTKAVLKSADEISTKNKSSIIVAELTSFFHGIQESLETFLVSGNGTEENTSNETNAFLQALSLKIYFKRINIDRVSKILTSLNNVVALSSISIDSVLIQILNSMLKNSQSLPCQLDDCHYVLLENIFRKLLLKLFKYINQDLKSTTCQRISVTILNFLSSYNFGSIKLINILIDNMFVDCIICLINKQPFITTEKWLVIEGNGDKNNPNACNIIGWCIFENFILQLSTCESDLCQERMVLLESQLRNYIFRLFIEISDWDDCKIFDLYSALKVVKHFYSKSLSFKNCCQSKLWMAQLLRMSTNNYNLESSNIFYSKYALNLIATEFLFSILAFEADKIKTELDGDQFSIPFDEIIQKFSIFFHYLLTKGVKTDKLQLAKSLESRINFYKYLNEDLDSLDNSDKCKWIAGNQNFDKINSFQCEFLTNDKISVKNINDTFFILNCEDLVSGIWRVSFDIECKENPVEFCYGFILNNNNKWPKDHISLMKFLKSNSSLSISCRSTVSHRLSCTIDIDQCFTYFSNGNNTIQPFKRSADGNYRFFIASLKNHSNYFQLSMLSVKQLCFSQLGNELYSYRTPLISPDQYILFNTLYSGFNTVFQINPLRIQKHIIIPLLEQNLSLQQFEMYVDQNIFCPSRNAFLLFALFLMTDNFNDHGFHKGEMCYELRKDNTRDFGFILDFKNKDYAPLNGLNFVDKLLKAEDVQCTFYSLTLDKNKILSVTDLKKVEKSIDSVFLSSINSLLNNDIIKLMEFLFNNLTFTYYDMDISNYEKEEWLNENFESLKVDFHFTRCLCSRLLMQLLFETSIIDFYLKSDNQNHINIFKRMYSTIIDLASRPSPLRKYIHVNDFPNITFRILNCFYHIYWENELNVVRKYAHIFMESNRTVDLRGHLNKSESRILLRALEKQQFGQNLIENFSVKSNNEVLSAETQSVTFNDRRRKLLEVFVTNSVQLSQSTIPVVEFEMSDSTNQYSEENFESNSSQIEVSQSTTNSQRSMDEFVIRSVNKNKKTCICPICDVVIKLQSQSLFSHLSVTHPYNCNKFFQHHASKGIELDGSLSNLNENTVFCASITRFTYCVCDEYLRNKVNKKQPNATEDFNKFINTGYISNTFIGWSGTKGTETYCYPKMSEFDFTDAIRPKLDQTKILGDHIHQEINYSKISLNTSKPEANIKTDTCLLEEISFVCQVSCLSIIKSLKRLEYSFIIIMTRMLLIKLTEHIFRRNSLSDAAMMTKRFFLSDWNFIVNIIKLLDGGRFRLQTSEDDYDSKNKIQRNLFKETDFLFVLILALESNFDDLEKMHNFVVNFILCLENFLTINENIFHLNIEFDANILLRPSTLLVQLLFSTIIKYLSTLSCSWYESYQNEVEQIIELLVFGVISNNTKSKVKIWCLNGLIQIFQLIKTPKLENNSDGVNMIDLRDDLSTEDSSTIHLGNCNSTVKKLISSNKDGYILTADCGGTMRFWDIDSIAVSEHLLKQTFLFSLGDCNVASNSSGDKRNDSPEIMGKCLKIFEPLKFDLSNYLIEVGVQTITVSANGSYLAESIGVCLNIWNIRCINSKPYVTSFRNIIIGLNFPKQKFAGLHGCQVDILLVALTDGELFLLQIFDNGTRVIHQQLSKLSDIESNVTAVTWNDEKNPIFIGYNDGSLVLRHHDQEKIITLHKVHDNRISFLLYCPYTTATLNGEEHILASCSADEDKIGIWQHEKLLCVLSIKTVISSVEWLSEKFVRGIKDEDNENVKDKKYIIIIGSKNGLIQFWQFSHCGTHIEKLFTFCGHVGAILKLKVCESTNVLASGCNNGFVNVWSIRDRTLISTCRGDGFVMGIEWTPKNNLVAAFSQSQYIKIWRTFTCDRLQTSGIRQWAHIRKLFLRSTKINSIKHLKHLKTFSMSLYKLLNEQFVEENESLKSGFSIVFSQYLKTLIKFTTFIDLIPKFIPCSVIEPISSLSEYSTAALEMESVPGQRTSLTHSLNLKGSTSLSLSSFQFDWLLNLDKAMKITQFLCFENDDISLLKNDVPKWWWVWCIGSDEYLHHYLHSRWRNKHWTKERQFELYQWYENCPKDWINEYSNSTYVWGCSKFGELGILQTQMATTPKLIQIEGIQQVICGTGVTLIITCEGKLMGCGEGLQIIFNPFMREEPYQFINVPVISDYKVTHVAASQGPEGHIIAITSFGEVFSWGFGTYGKLGHGHSTTLKKPKLIEVLRGKSAVMADCGYNHSGVVTSTGSLYTFGFGSNGQLGLETCSDSDTPKLVDFKSSDIKIGMVACGENHTLALSQDGWKLFAFGAGSCGQLGIGEFKDHFRPKQVDLQRKSLAQICCGQNFSVALTSNGHVMTWGHANFASQNHYSLSDNDSRPHLDDSAIPHIPTPSVNLVLSSTGIIVNICAGSKNIFVITSTGDLYGWGSNANNLFPMNNNNFVYKPELCSIRKGSHWRQVSCSSNHVAVSSHSPYSYRNDIPSGPQLIHNDSRQMSLAAYPALNNSELNICDMTCRLILILYWNQLIRLTWQFWIPQTNQHIDTYRGDINISKDLSASSAWPILNSREYLFPQSNWNWRPFHHFQSNGLRQLLDNEMISTLFYRYLNMSMIHNRTYNTLVRIDRIDKKESVFLQTCRQVLRMNMVDLRMPWRSWKVKLVNEGADDAGGAYDETISEICNELEGDDIEPKVLIPIPSDNSTFIINPNPNVPVPYLHFLGILMGTAVRTKKPIDLHLDPLFWKRLTKSNVTIDDLIRLDPAYINSLLSLKDDVDILNNDDNELKEVYGLDKFTCFSTDASETETIPNGWNQTVDCGNLSVFVDSCINYRLYEFDNAIEIIRQGFCCQAPMTLLDLISWKRLEKMVCGSKSINISILKSIARYVDADENDIIFTWFWDILESFTELEKSLFLRFVTGKSRLPSQDSDIPFRLFIYITKQPANCLPQSQTCFNQIRLPRYTSRFEMESKLKLAISQCRSIDMDDYMLVRNREH